jgi:hypothetical protein
MVAEVVEYFTIAVWRSGEELKADVEAGVVPAYFVAIVLEFVVGSANLSFRSAFLRSTLHC